MEEAIRVCIRQRPLFPQEIEAGHSQAWTLKDDGRLLIDYKPPNGPPIHQIYSFDMCFDVNSTNKEVYEKTARDIVRDTTKGINGCYMAYGQTGCGKTYSIMGTPEDPGILPRAVSELFYLIEHGNLGDDNNEVYDTEYLLRVSYVEIYLERVNDLFQDGPKGETQPLENLDVKEDPKGGFNVVGLAEREVTCMEDVMRLIRTAELKRHFATTNFNETSSRSHTVFTAIVESTQTFKDGTDLTRRGELKLVDLAGNERATSGEGLEEAKERQAEGQAINKSLFLLSEVIAKLSKRAELQKKGASTDKQKREMLHIPWRDSKLTRLLRKSLGGNARACLLVAVHPSVQALEISFSTLRFAQKTKQIKKKIVENFVSVEKSLIAKQKETINCLQKQLIELQKVTSKGGTGALQMKGNVALSDGGNSGDTGETNEIKNESIATLKETLEKKIEKLSRLILHTTFDDNRNATVDNEGISRSLTISGVQSRYRKLETLRPTLQNQLYHLPPNRAYPMTSEESLKPILSAIKYLSDAIDTNQDTVAKKHPATKDPSVAGRLPSISGSKKEARKRSEHSPFKPHAHWQLIGLKIENERLLTQNGTSRTRIQFIQKLLSTLGITALMTSSGVLSDTSHPVLSYTLDTMPRINTQDVEKEEALIDYVRHQQTLAYAMLAKVFARVAGRYCNIEQELPTKPIDTLFSLLNPWEQNILAIAHEHQTLQENVKQLKKMFQRGIAKIYQKLHSLVADRVELMDHTSRMIHELRELRYEHILQDTQEGPENVGRTLSHINELSLELATKSAECQDLNVKYQEVVSERDALQERLDDMMSWNNTFNMPLFLNDSRREDDPKYKEVMGDLIKAQTLASNFRIQLEECHVLYTNLYKVNQELSSELIYLYSALHTRENDCKLLQCELRNERVEMRVGEILMCHVELRAVFMARQKKLEDTTNMLINMEKERNELKKELARMAEEKDRQRTRVGTTFSKSLASELRGRTLKSQVSRIMNPEKSMSFRRNSSTSAPFSTPQASLVPLKSIHPSKVSFKVKKKPSQPARTTRLQSPLMLMSQQYGAKRKATPSTKMVSFGRFKEDASKALRITDLLKRPQIKPSNAVLQRRRP